MSKKVKIGWEKAILEIIEKHNGIATLKNIYKEVPSLIEDSNSTNFEHTIRGYLQRLKTNKKLIKQVGLSTYALSNIKVEENIFENINSNEFKKSFLNEIPKEKIHDYVEGILVELGNFSKYETYTADKSAFFNGKPLSDIISYKEISNFSYPVIINHVKQIDVIWFKNGFPIKTFDVENSTDFTKALLRAYQLRFFKTKFFLVSDENKKNIYKKKILTEPFNEIKNDCIFLSYKEIYDVYKSAALHNEQVTKSSIFMAGETI